MDGAVAFARGISRRRNGADGNSIEASAAMSNATDPQADLSGGRTATRSPWGTVAAVVVLTVAAAVVVKLIWPAADVQPRSPPMPAVSEPQSAAPKALAPALPELDRFTVLRQRMVDVQLAARDIRDERVLDVMRRVPRHLFVPESQRESAYADWPLQIGEGQTISQPYIVALMTQLAQPKPESRALDVGTGSGYQAAVLAELCRDVYSIEIIESLATDASLRLAELGYRNVEVRCGDGYRGWLEHAPYDVIILAAAPSHIPEPLVEQLAPGGRLVLPVGGWSQELVVVEKQADGTTRKWSEIGVVFVPMTGEAERPKSR
jgi:protein-L-isoaspartate(D-aspartate) O-methyltransferase